MFPLMLLYVALTIVRPQDYVPGVLGLPLLSGVLALALLIWLVAARKPFDVPQFQLLPVFLLLMMVSQVANHWVGGAIEMLGRFGPTLAAFMILATAVAQDPARMRKTFAVFALCAFVLVAHSIEQKQLGVGWTGMNTVEDGRVRYVGIFNDPNDLGLLFVAVLPMAAYLSTGAGFLRRVFWLAGAAFLVYGVYLTNSRGALLAVLVVGGGYIWYRRGIVTAGTLGVIGLIVMKALSSRMGELDADESSAAGRVDAWYEGFQMFFEHPLFGVGPHNFTDYNYLTAHNSFVLVLAEMGFAGFLVWLAFVGYGFWMMATILRQRQPPGVEAAAVGAAPAVDWLRERQLALTMLLSMGGMFAAAFFLSRSYTVTLYLVMALAVGHYVGVRRRHPALRSFYFTQDAPRWVAITLGAIIALYVIVKILLMTS